MMYGWSGDMGIWGYIMMSISMLIFWGAIIAGVVLLARSLRSPGHPHYQAPPSRSAEDLLAERFARGEIDEAEYQNRLAVLRNR